MPSSQSLRRPRRFRPAFEALEDRRLLTDTGSVQLSGNFGISTYAGVGFQYKVAASISGYLNGQVDPNLAHFQAQIDWEGALNTPFIGSPLVRRNGGGI